MKIKLLSLLFILCLSGCREETDSEMETEVIKVTLTGTELYDYKFSDSHPVEGGYDIRKQAQNFRKSEMTWATYIYQAKEGFRGTEIVEIVLFGSPGDNNYKDYYKWIFEITVL